MHHPEVSQGDVAMMLIMRSKLSYATVVVKLNCGHLRKKATQVGSSSSVSVELYFLFLIYQLNVVIVDLSFGFFFSNLSVECTDFSCSFY